MESGSFCTYCETRNMGRVLVENLKENVPLKDLGIIGRTILTFILRK
jgi:hypothetical protein